MLLLAIALQAAAAPTAADMRYRACLDLSTSNPVAAEGAALRGAGVRPTGAVGRGGGGVRGGGARGRLRERLARAAILGAGGQCLARGERAGQSLCGAEQRARGRNARGAGQG